MTPVQFGDIWRVGGHVYACGDVSLGHNIQLIERAYALTNRDIDMVYVDPPWNAGIAKMFRTQLEGKSERKVDFKPLHDGITDPLPDVDVYLETGKSHAADMQLWFPEQGYTILDLWETAYSGGKCWIFHMHRTPVVSRVWEDGVAPSPVGLKPNGVEEPKWAINRSTRPGDLVYDPCMGLGGTAVAAAETGRISLGLELVPARVAKGIDRLAKLTGLEPVKMGELT